jgi:catechol 2,3-dioxygenase-like lactoylglutathione lyase family enzyme
VLDWMRHGITRREIARRRGTSLDAVKFHLDNITGKLGIDRRADLRHWPGYPAGRHLEEPMSDELRLTSLGQVALVVRDIARAEAFYRDTLRLSHLFTFGELAFFDVGGTRLYLRAVQDEDWRPGSILYFTVEEIRGAYEALVAAGVVTQGAPHRIHQHEDGTEEWMTFFADPDGNTLALMSRVPAA